MMDLNIVGLHDSEIGQIAAKVRELDDETLVRIGFRAALGLGAPSAPVMPAPVVATVRRGRKPKADKPAAKKVAAKASRAPRVPKDSPVIDDACEKIVEHLKGHATEGSGAEQIRAALGMEKPMFNKAIKVLLSHCEIWTKGQKRATRYFPKG